MFLCLRGYINPGMKALSMAGDSYMGVYISPAQCGRFLSTAIAMPIGFGHFTKSFRYLTLELKAFVDLQHLGRTNHPWMSSELESRNRHCMDASEK